MAEVCDLLCLDLPKAEAIRAQQLEPAAAERAVVGAQALADRTRLHIASALARTDELCGCDIAWITGRSQKLVSHHLKLLRQARPGRLATRRQDRLLLADRVRPLAAGRRSGGAGVIAQELAAPRADYMRAVRRVKQLSWLSLVWMCAEGAIAIAAGVVAGSIALVGFGLDSAIEGFASLIIVWRFTGPRLLSDAAEQRAQKLVAIQFFLLAPYVAVESVQRADRRRAPRRQLARHRRSPPRA